MLMRRLAALFIIAGLVALSWGLWRTAYEASPEATVDRVLKAIAEGDGSQTFALLTEEQREAARERAAEQPLAWSASPSFRHRVLRTDLKENEATVHVLLSEGGLSARTQFHLRREADQRWRLDDVTGLPVPPGTPVAPTTEATRQAQAADLELAEQLSRAFASPANRLATQPAGSTNAAGTLRR